MVNQFHLHYAKNIIPSQEAIQISGIQKEEESTHQNLKKKKNNWDPRLLGFQLNMINTFKYSTKAPGWTAPNRNRIKSPSVLK